MCQTEKISVIYYQYRKSILILCNAINNIVAKCWLTI
nr:MAG TPA: Aphid transmission protein [Caudoviricetes sp.]